MTIFKVSTPSRLLLEGFLCNVEFMTFPIFDVSDFNMKNFFPQEFKTLMAQAPELRSKLESAVRSQQHAASAQKTALETENENKTAVQTQQPSIKLKTKFEFS